MQLGLKDVSGRAKTAKRQVHRLRNTKCSCIIFALYFFDIFIVWFGYLCASQREAAAGGQDDVGFGSRPCD